MHQNLSIVDNIGPGKCVRYKEVLYEVFDKSVPGKCICYKEVSAIERFYSTYTGTTNTIITVWFILYREILSEV